MAIVTKQHHKIYTFTVVTEKDEDGYFVYVPQLQGCHTQGETYEEAMANIEDALKLYLDDMIAHGEEIPQETGTTVSLKQIVVSV